MADHGENLFERAEQRRLAAQAPLAVRMRPTELDDFVGQEHFMGPGKLLRRMLQADRLSSLIFYGPPGSGKTSLARVIAAKTRAEFHYLSAPAASVRDVRDICAKARDRLATGGDRTLLFLDEIHRFNRAQQDVLLDDVENGVILLIGATTENPYFSVNSPLISRSTVFQFEPLTIEHVLTILRRALADPQRGLGRYRIEADDEALRYLAVACDGDARRALTALEVAVLSSLGDVDAASGDRGGAGPATVGMGPGGDKKAAGRAEIRLDVNLAKESIQQKSIQYDGSGDTHYDLASAFQKSMRGSDPDATVYWLARMIAGGEDVRFIARRIAVCAAEDVGNADPAATMLAAAAVQIAEFVGLPEAQLPLAQAAIYVACAPKSNAAAEAIWQAVGDVQKGRTIPVPPHLRDAHYPGAKKLGHGQGYVYPHSRPGGFVAQDYVGQDLGKRYYNPKPIGREKKLGDYLQTFRDQLERCRRRGSTNPPGQA